MGVMLFPMSLLIWNNVFPSHLFASFLIIKVRASYFIASLNF